MHPSRKYLDPNELVKLQGLHLRARAIVDGFLAGRHRSTGRGLSLEFTEHREYSAGDDWRHVDWKIFGRTDKYYLKQFEDESNLACYFILDSSESMSYCGPDVAQSKLEYAKCLVASLGWLILQRRDAIGLATFGDKLGEYLPASCNPSNLDELVDRLERTEPSGQTNPQDVLFEFADRTKRRSVVVLLSDCFMNRDAFNSALQRLTFDGHDVAVMQILDAAEIDFPFNSITTFRGLESQPNITTDSARIAKAYRRRFDDFCKQIEFLCNKNEVRHQLVSTSDSFDVCLSRFLAPVSGSV
jgi:uncharacterized protein (DUF58 family)